MVTTRTSFEPNSYAQSFPVSVSPASTGLDSGEPFCRKKMESTTNTQIDKNSLCQFWNDSNQKVDDSIYSSVVNCSPPCSACSWLCFDAPATPCITNDAAKSRTSARLSEFS